jgi:hypothetical protein
MGKFRNSRWISICYKLRFHSHTPKHGLYVTNFSNQENRSNATVMLIMRIVWFQATSDPLGSTTSGLRSAIAFWHGSFCSYFSGAAFSRLCFWFCSHWAVAALSKFSFNSWVSLSPFDFSNQTLSSPTSMFCAAFSSLSLSFCPYWFWETFSSLSLNLNLSLSSYPFFSWAAFPTSCWGACRIWAAMIFWILAFCSCVSSSRHFFVPQSLLEADPGA